jgi:zinc-ribbon domain
MRISDDGSFGGTTVHCVSCGTENSEEEKFCQACGTALAEAGASIGEVSEEMEPGSQVAAADAPPAAPEAPVEPTLAPAALAQATQAPTTPNGHPRFAPITLDQAAALLESEKRYPWISVPAGVVSFIILMVALGYADSQGSYYFPVSILCAAAIYVGTHFLLLPAVWPATVRCPHCAKIVPTSKHALPKVLWPWACPHCNQELAPQPA